MIIASDVLLIPSEGAAGVKYGGWHVDVEYGYVWHSGGKESQSFVTMRRGLAS
ncbi:hypothetical protein [Caballeronia sp. LZ001]|uniref:hypothetical protein n=1 Tax=Caballeronia sp. LZ001 TaxID=3038553 RepID=UPI002857A6A9|nr:hypothetical protein [Caballeronia sp. LZ001]MDR5806468.1 hypothetical protein [Caballeronia sp. LZ001]